MIPIQINYDNFNAIEVPYTDSIPSDYDGVMGVPITFLDKYNPEQFEILGLSQKVGYGLKSHTFYDDFKETRQDGTLTGSSGTCINLSLLASFKNANVFDHFGFSPFLVVDGLFDEVFLFSNKTVFVAGSFVSTGCRSFKGSISILLFSSI